MRECSLTDIELRGEFTETQTSHLENIVNPVTRFGVFRKL
jgi:hypothetical protein